MKFIFYAFALFFLAACQSPQPTTPDEAQGINLKPYYFPLDSLEEGLVYEYREQNSGRKQYWYVKIVADTQDIKYLVTTQFNEAFEQEALSREWIIRQGCLLKDYLFFQYDSLKGQTVQIRAWSDEQVCFPFLGKEGEDKYYRFALAFAALPDTNNRIAFQRDRYFKGLTSYEWQGQKDTAAIFENRAHYTISNEKEGGYWDYDSLPEREVYFKGIGLVEHRKDYRKMNRPEEVWKLEKRYDMQALEAKLRAERQ